MDRHSLRQVLLSRGIRIADDDPLFLLLEVNEVHFDAIAARHIQSLDQRFIANVVSRVLTRPTSSPAAASRSGDADAMQVLRSLEQATSKFLNLEKVMTEVAAAAATTTSKQVLDRSLKDLSGEITSILARIEKGRAHELTVVDSTRKVIDAAAAVQRAVNRQASWWLISFVAVLLAMLGGLWAGQSLTTSTVDKVQAACTSKQTQ